jgi:hypothetical protein
LEAWAVCVTTFIWVHRHLLCKQMNTLVRNHNFHRLIIYHLNYHYVMYCMSKAPKSHSDVHLLDPITVSLTVLWNYNLHYMMVHLTRTLLYLSQSIGTWHYPSITGILEYTVLNVLEPNFTEMFLKVSCHLIEWVKRHLGTHVTWNKYSLQITNTLIIVTDHWAVES